MPDIAVGDGVPTGKPFVHDVAQARFTGSWRARNPQRARSITMPLASAPRVLQRVAVERCTKVGGFTSSRLRSFLHYFYSTYSVFSYTLTITTHSYHHDH